MNEAATEESFECSICGQVEGVILINHFFADYVHPGYKYRLSSSLEGCVLEMRAAEESE